MQRYLYLAIISLLIFSQACKKEDTTKVVLPPTHFQPVTDGSAWTYAEYPVINLYSTYSTGIDSVFNKKKYHQMFTTNSGFTWLRNQDGIYYKLVPNQDTVIEFTYLKDNVPVGTGWQKTYDIDGFPTTYKFLVIEYDVPKLIYGQIYEHCITMKEEVHVDFGTVPDSLISKKDYTYANDIGLVLINNGDNTSVYLKSCNIYP